MVLFFQFDVPAELGLPFHADSHLSVFMCPEHNEIPSFEHRAKLPSGYWETTEGHWYASFTKPCGETGLKSPEFLQPAKLVLADTPVNQREIFAIGGAPEWIQEPEAFTCSCGAEMVFLCQLSDGYEFPKLENAPPQPDSSSENAYVLFLGNEVYVFACANQCNSKAVWISVQN